MAGRAPSEVGNRIVCLCLQLNPSHDPVFSDPGGHKTGLAAAGERFEMSCLGGIKGIRLNSNYLTFLVGYRRACLSNQTNKATLLSQTEGMETWTSKMQERQNRWIDILAR